MSFERVGLLTSFGRRVYLDDPWSSHIHRLDIAMALARQCRFAGHLRPHVEHYSVAQHSVLVSKLCLPEHARLGLLHDAAEAYVQDITRPLRRILGASSEAYVELESRWLACIGQRFGVGDALLELPEDVVHADQVCLVTEMRDVYWEGISHEATVDPAPWHIEPLGAFAAYELFCNRMSEVLL